MNRALRYVLVPIFLALSACMTAPTMPATLVIEPAISVAKIGTPVHFAALVSDSRGRRPAESVTWTVSDSQAARIEPTGDLVGLTNGRVDVRATDARSLTATLALRVVPDYSGNWQITTTITDCSRISGDGPSICRFELAHRALFSLTLSQTDAGVNGEYVLVSTDSRGILTGTVQDDGALVLNGRMDMPSTGSYSLITDWRSRLADSELIGEYGFESHFTNAFGPQVNRYRITTQGVRVS